ncbi:MAG: hypothetical protein KA717_33205 [Woronichinia naegeliana WA131]|uniref:Uncharacterized protein n=1 Tax=Woronichinia naegeliana WA131 TaxID=2824559 RepID=A0A977KUX0_9CYAN|nr:MAG: hypothetical protein KA717_33205 [Woronichinia naegeliana WA131]
MTFSASPNYNESGDLQARIEEYKRETGCYPESVHVDKIYRTKGVTFS